MISAHNLTVDFGKQLLFDSINFVISPKDRIALVGKNGAGKSTLLKLLAGLESPSFGQVERPKQLRIGYLPQVMTFSDVRTVLQEVEMVFSDFLLFQEQYDQLTSEMAERTDFDSLEYADLIERHAHLTDLLQLHHKGTYLADMERTLLGLGFSREDFERSTQEFSGGWRMRIELAKVLLSRPDILLLDEPTNHLDIESISWLEQFLSSSKTTLVLISHDRAFIDATTNRTIEIENGKIYDYKASYSHYLDLRKERVEQQLRAYENQQKKIEETEAFVEKFRYKATKSNQVQSRLKQLEKIERIEIDDQDQRHINFSFLQAGRSGDFPIIVDELSKNYGSLEVLKNVSITIRRGEKVAFVGKNGSGKTTLIRCLMGEIQDYSGIVKIGHGVEIAYFSQNRAQELNEKLTIRETIDRAAVGPIRERINDMLGAFMFGGELADKPIRVLSGGERSRVAILQLLLEPANLLILDEPTNHLDMRSKDVLKEAIRNFTGTVLLVSHDRFFLDGLVDKVYEFSQGQVLEHMGGVEEYLRKRRAIDFEHLNSSTPKEPREALSASRNDAKENAALDYKQQKELLKMQRSLRKKVEEAEGTVAQLEQEIARLEQVCASENASTDDFTRYGKLQSQLTQAVEQWEEAELLLEEFLNQQGENS